MRIGIVVPVLPAPSLPAVAVPATAPDRALLLRVASIAAVTPWTVLDGAPAAEAAPLAVPLTHALPLPAAPAWRAALDVATTGAGHGATDAPTSEAAKLTAPLSPATTAPTSPLATMAAHASALPLPVGPNPATGAEAITALSAVPSALAGPVTRLGADRLTLSPATAALRTEAPPPTPNRAVGEFMLDLLEALTGEPRGQVQLLAPAARDAVDATAAANLAAKGADEVLPLLVRGTLRGEDAKLVDLTLGLSLQRPAGTAHPAGALPEAVRAALEQLAQNAIDLDYPGLATALAGHSARFQAVLEPQGLWPLQSFLLSGLLLFGPARAAEDVDDEPVSDEDGDAEAATHDDGQAARDDKPPPRKARRRKPVAPTVADDGGPPIITAGDWLELELRHWRTQLRLWMALPPLPAGPVDPIGPAPRLDAQA